MDAGFRGTYGDHMGILDDAKNMLGQHDDKVDESLDQAGELLKSKLGGHDEQIDGLVEKAKESTGDGDTTAAPRA